MLLPLEAHAPTDFDFFMGHWQVAHRRLKERLVGATAWDSFSGECLVQKTLGGFGNMDDNVLHLPAGAYRAITVRAFDAQQGTWAIWWLDGRHPGRLDVPVVGRFVGGVGTFLAEDQWEGRPMQVRFLWTVPRPDAPRWEQAFSLDAGLTWETNWVMDFTRGVDVDFTRGVNVDFTRQA
jgi:hypothetical protein